MVVNDGSLMVRWFIMSASWLEPRNVHVLVAAPMGSSEEQADTKIIQDTLSMIMSSAGA